MPPNMRNMACIQPRPSIDSVYDLLSNLDDNQAEDLLRDLNHTAPSNVPVAEALDFFEGPAENNTSSSTRSTRRRTTFLKSVSTFDLRSSSRATSQLPSPSSPSPSSALEPKQQQQQQQPPPIPNSSSSSPRARSASAVHRPEDDEAQRQKDQRFKTPRAYKRISRPWATLAPPSSGGPDVRDLLMAYLSPDSPSHSSFSSTFSASASSPSSSSCSSFSVDSPTTPRSTTALFYPGTIARMDAAEPHVDVVDDDDDDDSPSLADLLEPSPLRTKPKFGSMTPMGAAAGGLGRPAVLAPQSAGADGISGIFEVLSGGS